MRAEFHGDAIIEARNGAARAHLSGLQAVCSVLLSAVVTATMLGVALLVMSLMLNLEGYIKTATIGPSGYYVPMLAQLAAPGAIFDPLQTQYFGLVALVRQLLPCSISSSTNLPERRGVAGRRTRITRPRARTRTRWC